MYIYFIKNSKRSFGFCLGKMKKDLPVVLGPLARFLKACTYGKS